ncbi:PIH1 domain-containing protein 2-like [Glandiceps talaboti]
MATGQEDVMKQAQHIWSMLDELQDSDPDGYRKFLTGNFKEAREYYAVPKPFVCLSTNIMRPRKEKLYVNIAGWKKVPKPKTPTCGIPTIATSLDRIKEGKERYSTIICAFNQDILEECWQTSREKEMLLHLALDYIEDHRKIVVSRHFQVLDDIKFKGDPRVLSHAFKEMKSEPPKVDKVDVMQNTDTLLQGLGKLSTAAGSEIPGKDSDPTISLGMEKEKQKSTLIEEISSFEEQLPKPDFEISLKEADSKKPRRIMIKILLPEVTSVQECVLDISEDDLTLEVPTKYQLEIQLPENINDSSASARFNNKSSTLTVTMPTKRQS